MSNKSVKVLQPRVVVSKSEQPRALGLNGHRVTLLEARLPFRELSLLAHADRRAPDPVYAAHRWWARRPPSAMRGLLLAASLPSNTTPAAFWEAFNSDIALLSGRLVHDLFVGGGTTVVEAARLGATPSGTDVDPLAIEIVRHELRRPEARLVREAGNRLLAHLRQQAGHLFAGKNKAWTPVHYFFIHEVMCPGCHVRSSLYRTLEIARFSGKNGAVVRAEKLVAFCPECFDLHHLMRAGRRELRCCGHRHRLADGTFVGQRFRCPHCGEKASHRELKTGIAVRRLIAVEESSNDQRRRIRKPSAKELELDSFAAEHLCRIEGDLHLPTKSFARIRVDDRPLSFGVTKPRELFSARQLVVFGLAFRWVRSESLPRDVRRALLLAVSNALTTNNRLCSYATEYGRLAPLFSVRSYSLPSLAVELNPLHPSAGRGTLSRSIDRVVRSTDRAVRRYIWDVRQGRPTATEMRFAARPNTSGIVCASAESPPKGLEGPIDLCLFDPPYFDYIAYSELSEFYRAWLSRPTLGGDPLLPDPGDPVRTFSRQLARCLLAVKPRLRRGAPMVFTYHSASADAWTAIGQALDLAGLRITALWPLRNDSHMGHHSSDGNCEWDLVVVCRKSEECASARLQSTVTEWAAAARPLRIRPVDRRSMTHAVAMASSRFGRALTQRANGQGGTDER